MMKSICIGLFSLTATPGIAYADSCSDILKDGVFDSVFSSTSSSTSEQLNEWLEKATYEEVKGKIDAGISIPIKGIPLGANFNKENFKKFQEDLKQGKTTGFDAKSAQEFVEKNASPVIVSAWLECMKGGSAGVHVSALANPDAPEQITVTVRFVPYDETTKVPTVAAFSLLGNAKIIGFNPFVPGAELSFQPRTANVLRERSGDTYPAITATLNTKNASDSDVVPAFSLQPQSPNVVVQIFPGPTSQPASHPEASADVPSGYKLVGGGALVSSSGPGNLLTASYPADAHTWRVRSKDHVRSSPGTVQAFAVGLYDPKDEWDVRIFQSSSTPAAHPEVRITVDPDFAMTGGGAIANWSGPGNMLTALFPISNNTWVARSKDHTVSESVVLTGYAIGIKPKNGALAPTVSVNPSTSAVVAHPEATATVTTGYTLTGGGALDDWRGAGNLLTAAYPSGSSFRAAGKDHLVSDPAPLTAFAIGIKARSDLKTTAYKSSGPLSFVQGIDWVGQTYQSSRTGKRVPLMAGGRPSAAFLSELRANTPTAAARIGRSTPIILRRGS